MQRSNMVVDLPALIHCPAANVVPFLALVLISIYFIVCAFNIIELDYSIVKLDTVAYCVFGYNIVERINSINRYN